MNSVPETVTFHKGEMILQRGQAGEEAYLVQAGRVAIFLPDPDDPDQQGGKSLGTINPGGMFGEMALIDPAPRAASARALEHTICFRISRQVLQRGLNQAPPLVRYLLRSFVRNIRTANGDQLDIPEETLDARHLSESDASRRILERRSYAEGDVIFRQDAHGKVAYLLQSGTVDIIRDDKIIRRLGPGEVFGELALLRDTPRYAMAQAASGVMVEVIRHDQFDDILSKAPVFLQALVRIYVEMIGSGDKR